MSTMLFQQLLFAQGNCFKETVSDSTTTIYLSILLFLSLSFRAFKYPYLTFLVLVSAISHDFIKIRAILPWKCRRYQINCSALARRCDLFGSFPPHVSTSEGDYRHRNPFVGIITSVRFEKQRTVQLKIKQRCLILPWYANHRACLKNLIISFNFNFCQIVHRVKNVSFHIKFVVNGSIQLQL